jgi:hypothetical protein
MVLSSVEEWVDDVEVFGWGCRAVFLMFRIGDGVSEAEWLAMLVE